MIGMGLDSPPASGQTQRKVSSDMAEFETVEEIKERWNKPPGSGGMTRMLGGDRSPEDTRATVADNPEVNDSATSSKIDAVLPKETRGSDDFSLTPANGAGFGAVVDEYTEKNMAELREEIDSRNEDLGEDEQISKGGSADDLRSRLREHDAQSEDSDA